MKAKISAPIALLAALFITGYCGSARANSFNFTFLTTSAQILSSGTITTSGPFVNGTAPVTAVTGTFQGFAITGLLPTSTPNFQTNNLLYSSAPYVDLLGIIFGTSNNSTVVNVFFQNGQNFASSCTQTVIQNGQCFAGSPSLSTIPGTLSVTQTPEPGTLALFGTGLAGLGALLRRRRSLKLG